MNYIYDLYINLNNRIYDFFDWNKNDKIIHIKKIPVIKVDEENLRLLTKNKTCINSDTMIKIYNKTEIWNTNNKIAYCALFTDGYDIIAIEFDNKGYSIKKSYLSIDEELEVLEITKKLDISKIEIKTISKEKNIFKTRKQLKEEKFIYDELKNMEESKLNYIYFECFGKQEKDKNIILDRINKISKNSKIYKNLYDILKLTSSTKK